MDIDNNDHLPLSENAFRQNGLKLKVCGMKYNDNIKAIAKLQPDYLGFIYFKNSSRYFSGIIPELPKTIKKVGVFVDAPESEVIQNIMSNNLDFIQLHGNESATYCYNLQLAQFGDTNEYGNYSDHKVKIIKAFSMNDAFDFNLLEHYETVCDYFLFDTKGKLPGGNGFTFNWDILKDYPFNKPYFLSGGIGLEEDEKIKKFLEEPVSKYCHAIDVNSRFEVEPGLKDVKLLEKFKAKLSF